MSHRIWNQKASKLPFGESGGRFVSMMLNSSAQTQTAAMPSSIQMRFFVIFIVGLTKGVKQKEKHGFP